MKTTPSPAGSALRRLESAARAAARRAYAPYSHFPVGAAVLTASGRIFAGCNVENASYGLTLCAERGAVQAAVAAGERQLRAVVVYTPTREPTAPCGACRQVLSEFGGTAGVVSICDSERRLEASLASLLPSSFGPGSLAAAAPPKGRTPAM